MTSMGITSVFVPPPKEYLAIKAIFTNEILTPGCDASDFESVDSFLQQLHSTSCLHHGQGIDKCYLIDTHRVAQFPTLLASYATARAAGWRRDFVPQGSVTEATMRIRQTLRTAEGRIIFVLGVRLSLLSSLAAAVNDAMQKGHYCLIISFEDSLHSLPLSYNTLSITGIAPLAQQHRNQAPPSLYAPVPHEEQWPAPLDDIDQLFIWLDQNKLPVDSSFNLDLRRIFEREKFDNIRRRFCFVLACAACVLQRYGLAMTAPALERVAFSYREVDLSQLLELAKKQGWVEATGFSDSNSNLIYIAGPRLFQCVPRSFVDGGAVVIREWLSDPLNPYWDRQTLPYPLS